MNCPLSKYSNILGIPMEGIHKYRLLDTAMVDYILTIISAIVIAFFTKIPLVFITVLLFIISIFLHYLFGINTVTNQYLGLKCI